MKLFVIMVVMLSHSGKVYHVTPDQKFYTMGACARFGAEAHRIDSGFVGFECKVK